ncbi:hypothetical protein [Methanobacterium spitsbergense]|uniref:Uncharacterized protein n=1 Tax=Methanobacterium spitsbergense TaxID=2874285 RepID=A0A8T5UV17_9EURY|nr:hypothetical protein [Methanobacterium spitsbergense]MBZ2165766.1 hypothetical protein [Methanobacterium spitsbergense]
MQENENIAGGMSYRTMKGINFNQIGKYLDGNDNISSTEILEKNKNYFIASANKIIARIKLAKKRSEYGLNNNDHVRLINLKISASLRWLEKLKKDIKSDINSEFLNVKQYKKWHAVKLLPSAIEGIIITSKIKYKLLNIDSCYSGSSKQNIEEAKKYIENAEIKFLRLLNLNENSDFKQAESIRILAYNESILADKKLESFIKKKCKSKI